MKMVGADGRQHTHLGWRRPIPITFIRTVQHAEVCLLWITVIDSEIGFVRVDSTSCSPRGIVTHPCSTTSMQNKENNGLARRTITPRSFTSFSPPDPCQARHLPPHYRVAAIAGLDSWILSLRSGSKKV
ncbi:hypothetical protein LY78DRAFT_144960 [Colletotrichum sublineola]|nr:hypothetical protein LY78DRAFT_144960 [Colletotrichum sublineola]